MDNIHEWGPTHKSDEYHVDEVNIDTFHIHMEAVREPE